MGGKKISLSTKVCNVYLCLCVCQCVCARAQTKQEECHKTFSVGRCFSGCLQAQRQEETPARPVGGRAMFHQTSGSSSASSSCYSCSSFSSSSSTPCSLSLQLLHQPTFARVVFPGNSRTKAGRERVRHRGLSQPGRPRQSCFAAQTQRWVLCKSFTVTAHHLCRPSWLFCSLSTHVLPHSHAQSQNHCRCCFCCLKSRKTDIYFYQCASLFWRGQPAVVAFHIYIFLFRSALMSHHSVCKKKKEMNAVLYSSN